MNKFKKILEYLKNPPIWFAAIIWAIFLGILTIAILFICYDRSTEVYTIVVDAFGALLMGYSIYLAIKLTPKMKAYLKNGPSKSFRINKFLSDYNYRAIAFAIFSFFFNASYAALQLTLAFFTRSPWLFSFGLYYAVLAILRGILVYIGRNNQLTSRLKLRLYFDTGLFITGLGLVIIPIVYMAYLNLTMARNFGQILAIGSALYTFIKVILAIHNVNKVRKQKDYYLQSIKNVSFVDALVSLFSLEITMLTVFSTNESSNAILNVGTGTFICLIVTAMGIYMIVNGYKKSKGTITYEDKRDVK